MRVELQKKNLEEEVKEPEVNSTSEPGVDQHSAHRELPKVLSLEMFIISSAPECCTLSVIFTHPICVPTAEPAPDGLSSSTGSSE